MHNYEKFKKSCSQFGYADNVEIFFFCFYYFMFSGGDPDKQFSVHRTTGLLKVAKALDYEIKNQYILTVKAADSANPPEASTATVTINILDESDSEPECSETAISATVSETVLTGDQVI